MYYAMGLKPINYGPARHLRCFAQAIAASGSLPIVPHPLTRDHIVDRGDRLLCLKTVFLLFRHLLY